MNENNNKDISISTEDKREEDAFDQIMRIPSPESNQLTDEESKEADMVYRLQTLLPHMPKTAKKISLYIINNPQKFLESSISQLANKIGVSASAITRYSQYMGYSGFSELKYRFEVSYNTSSTGAISAEDDLDVLKSKMTNNYKRAFEDTITHLDNKALSKATDYIISANKIFIFGHGGSNYVAQLTEMLFAQMGIECHAYGNAPLASTASALLGTGDLAIGLSSSGNAKLTVDALRKAKKNGANTIAITTNVNSYLAQESDVALTYLVHTKDDLRYFHLLKQAELAIIGTLQLCVFQKNQQKMEENLKIFKDSFFGKLYVY